MSNTTNRTDRLLEQHAELCAHARDLMTRKNHDYTAASGDPFANFRGSAYLGIKPELGILLRMQDKMMRVRTFVEKGQLRVKDESVRDALVDLINYTVLLYGLTQEEQESNTEVTNNEEVSRRVRVLREGESITVSGGVLRRPPAVGAFCGSDYDLG